MRKIELVQGSQEWLSWRKKFVTATDAPALLGLSPYATPLQCWQRKTGQIPEQEASFAMIQGQLNEPIARKLFIKETGLDMVPVVIESDAYNFLGASLDGISECGEYLLEVKCNGMETHNFVKKNGLEGIPEYHFAQMQHQMLTTDRQAHSCFYVSYNNGEILIVEVPRHDDWIDDYLTEASKFWRQIVFFEPPALIDRDYTDMSDRELWESYSHEYKKLVREIKKLEFYKDEYKNKLVTMCQDKNCYGHGIKIFKKNVRGRVDYESIPELKDIDLDKFRKPSSETWTILIDIQIDKEI
jgi:putative phage-type endonuclease